MFGIDCEADGKCTEVRPQHSPYFNRWESAVKQDLRKRELRFQGNEPERVSKILSSNRSLLEKSVLKISWRQLTIYFAHWKVHWEMRRRCCHICFNFHKGPGVFPQHQQDIPFGKAENGSSQCNNQCLWDWDDWNISIPEPHPYRSPRKWFLWALWRSSHLCRSSDYKSHPRAGLDGNTSSWRTETKSGNGFQQNISGKQNAVLIQNLIQNSNNWWVKWGQNVAYAGQNVKDFEASLWLCAA